MELVTTFKDSINNLSNYKSVVLAIEKFSIGQDHTFSKRDLNKIINKAKKEKINVYVLVNKMIFDDEIPLLKETLIFLKKLEVTGIYFSDMAVFMLAKELELVSLLIYAPGMTLVNSRDVKEYLKLGILGVELANELTLEEKIMIAKNNPHQVGLVIAGYMLMSYSKREALSNYFKTINKNINVKNNYNLNLVEATRTGQMPIYEDQAGTYIYSEYILDSFKFIERLKNAQFKYFRIDGIFLSPQVIYDLYIAYRDCLMGIKSDYSTMIKKLYPQYTFDNIFYTKKTSEVK